MTFLLDSNVWLEVILQQQRADEAATLLKLASPNELAITEFSLSSIGIILTMREQRHEDYVTFLSDLQTSGVRVADLDLEQRKQIPQVAQQYGLDFDDAYQLVAARGFELRIVSFDADFKRTPEGALTPQAVIEHYSSKG